MPPELMQLMQGLMGGGGGQPQGQPGGAPPDFQPNVPAPQNPGMGQLNPGIMQLIQSVLTSLPDRPTPNVGGATGNMSVPGMARGLTPEEDLMNMIVGMMNNANPTAQAGAAAQGIGGMPFGGMGGRPVGS